MGSIDTHLISVFGATGNQGGSVVRSLLQNPAFRVRALTRNPSSNAAKKLADAGAEVVGANGFSSEDMSKAFHGSWGVFVNINSDDKAFADPQGPSEFDMGKIIVDAAVQAGVQHFVFSSGPPCSEMTGGKVRMKAMDMKYKIEQYASQLGAFTTVNPLGAAWFFENFLDSMVAPVFGGFPHFPDDEGYLTFRVPYWGGEERVPFVSISDDFGDIVQGIFLDPARYRGHFVHGVSDIRSFDQIVSDFEKVTGKKSRFQPILPSWEAFDTRGIPELEDVKLMFGFTQVTGGRYFGPEPTEKNTAADLKRATAIALNRPESEQNLVTAESWFRKHF